MSAPTPPRTRGRTGPSRSPTTCTSATPSRRRRPTGWSSRARTARRAPGRAAGGGAERAAVDFDEIVETWLPLTYALNAVNRSMGANDLYPFVLAPTVLEKLRFVHDLVQAHIPYRTPARLRSSTASSTSATASTEATAVQKPPTTSVG